MTAEEEYSFPSISSPPPPLLFAAKADFAAGVAERPRHSPYPLLPVDQALHIVLEHTPTLPAVETDNLIGNPFIKYYSITRNESCNCVVLIIDPLFFVPRVGLQRLWAQ